MKYVNAELVPVEGEEAVMQAIRNSGIPSILEEQAIVIPVCNLDDAPAELEHDNLWIPISNEDPLHISVDYRVDQHNVLSDASRPSIEFDEILYGSLTSEQREWLDSYRYTSVKTYKLIGTVAAKDIRVNPNAEIAAIEKEELEKANKAFEIMIGEWGALLYATVSYVEIEDTAETFTRTRFAIMETEEEFKKLRGKNPTTVFVQ